MFLQYTHEHSASYTLTALDLKRITPKSEDTPEFRKTEFPVGEPVEVSDEVGKLILEHDGLFDFIQVTEDGDVVEQTAKEKAEEPKSTTAGSTASPGATSNASAGASTAGSSAGSGTASSPGSSTGPSSGN